MTKLILLAAVAPLFPLAAAYADHPEHHRPPQEAFDACANAKRGDACTITHRDRTITGTCDAPPDETALACRPDHPPGPPPEAIAACTNLKVGDTCSFAHGSDEVPGTCSQGPGGTGPIACKPDHPPPHGHHHHE
jgi:hypothetical protein